MKQEKRISLQRQRRRYRVRNKVKRFSTRLRLSVFRSHKHIYAQVVDDEAGRTLVTASTVDKGVAGQISYGGNREAAGAVGKALAERALEAGIKQVAFDRRDYKYHGRVAALAEAARDAGLDLGAGGTPAETETKSKDKGKSKDKSKTKTKTKAKTK